LLEKIPGEYRTILRDTIYLGKNTIETRKQIVPTLKKMINKTATP